MMHEWQKVELERFRKSKTRLMTKTDKIREILRYYTDPKPKWDGMNTHELAEKILMAIEEEPYDTELHDGPPKEPTGSENELPPYPSKEEVPETWNPSK